MVNGKIYDLHQSNKTKNHEDHIIMIPEPHPPFTLHPLRGDSLLDCMNRVECRILAAL